MAFEPQNLLESAKNNLVSSTLASLGFKSGDNAVADQLDQIRAITKRAQSFVQKSIMGNGLTVENFAAANPTNNWNKVYPYRFLVTSVDSAGKHTIISEYRLPMNPQQMTISTPFAIKTTVTSRGILEEHNGIPLKRIMLRGTTGIYIQRSTYGPKEALKITGNPIVDSALGTVFGGTINAVQAAQRQVTTATNLLQSAFGGGSSDPDPFTRNQQQPQLTQTGYYQYQILRLFLETYAEVKKNPGTQDLRLLFQNTKDVSTYIVTPVDFTTDRNVSSPMEYTYSIQLLAWGTTELNNNPDAKDSKTLIGSGSTDVSKMQKLFNSMRALRNTLSSFKNIVSAARADVESNIFGPINNMILLAKDAVGIAQTIADFPKSLRDSFITSVVPNFASLARDNAKLQQQFGIKMGFMTNESTGSNQYAGSSATASNPSSAVNSFKSSVFDTVDFTDQIQINQLSLTDAQQSAINDAQLSALNTTANEVNTIIANLQSLSASLESTITQKNPLDEEWDILYSINDSVASLYSLLSDGSLNNSTTSDAVGSTDASLANTAMSFWEQTADNFDITFINPNGKFSIPFPFRSSLEDLAAIYLNDATRWPEIAALNGLQHPYIDEDGFSYSFLSNGSENQINLPSALNLYVGQTVYLMSDTQITSQRKILAISSITSTNFLITVDGLKNLALFKVSEHSSLKAYLPFTINSLKKIFIPSPITSNNPEFDTKPITFLNEDIELVKFSKIDWLLDSYGDLAVAKDGFVNLAFGTANLIQAAKTKLQTPAGSLVLHPEFGAGIEVGQSFAEVSLEELSKRITKSFEDDPRFSAPSSIRLTASPGVLQEDVVAVVANNNEILPITVPLTQK